MVRTDQLHFESETAQKRADELHWDDAEWARQAGIAKVTLQRWLNGDRSLKLRTVEAIVRPLGLSAVDLIRKNGKKKA